MKRMLIFLLLIVGYGQLEAQSIDTLRRIDENFARWNNATPGGSILIARGDKILYQKAYGLADLEHLAPNTTETIFECGSVSKQFTAMSILLLAKEGKLGLNDDVRKYIPELPVYDKVITIQHLMNHTSGLKDWGSVGALGGWPRTTRNYTHELALEIIFRQKSVNFTPGNEYSYSNSGYTLMTTIVEKLSGMSLEDFTRIRFFEPLGMKNTQWRSDFRKIIPGRSIAYSRTRTGYEQNMPFENIYGHGGLLTTTSDLMKWNTLLENHKIGGDDIYKERIRKGKLNNGSEIGYASGLFIAKINGFDEINHSGATAGYRGWLAYYPQKKLTVIMLSNDAGFNPATVGAQIAKIYLGEEVPKASTTAISVKPEELKKFEGKYRSIRNFDLLTLEFSDGKIKQNGRALFSSDANTLFNDNLQWIYLSKDKVMVKNSMDTSSYYRVKPVSAQFSLKDYTGTFRSDEADGTLLIDIRDNTLWVHETPLPSFKLTPEFQDAFTSNSGDLVEFTRNKQGTITGLTVSASRAEKVRFNKISK
ncbi:MAG: serine hydrolase [Cyclobacteriaceae bacterium]|nr:serine hydrolase [Cyclobacteriaceae bacterium]